MIIGINATKDTIFVAETRIVDERFQVSKVLRVQFEIRHAGDLSDLLQNISTILSHHAGSSDSSVAVLRCSVGQFGASVEAIKAEAIVELSAYHRDWPSPWLLRRA